MAFMQASTHDTRLLLWAAGAQLKERAGYAAVRAARAAYSGGSLSPIRTAIRPPDTLSCCRRCVECLGGKHRVLCGAERHASSARVSGADVQRCMPGAAGTVCLEMHREIRVGTSGRL